MLTIQSSSSGGTIFWKELHSSVTTNSFGLFTLVIGTGTKQIESTVDSFDMIDWSITPKYLKTEIYTTGPWLTMGTSQLYSVPYAMYSPSTNPWQTNGSNLYYSAGNVGIGTANPGLILHSGGSEGAPATSGVVQKGSLRLGPGHLALDFGTLVSPAWGTWLQATNIIDLSNKYNLLLNPNGGAIGIGTINPDKILTVQSPVTNTQIAKFADDARYIGLGRDQVGSYDLSGNPANLFLNNGALTVSSTGNVGIGTTNPAEKLHVNGGIISSSIILNGAGQTTLRLYKPDNSVDQRITELDALGSGGNFIGRFVNDAYTQAENWLNVARNPGTYTVNSISFPSGNVGVGAATSARLAVQTSTTWADDVPLFEVRNKIGVPILAVYNNGVRILVDHTYGKALKGGFAVGGYDQTKAGKTVDFMTISPDSIRFNINNDNTAKGLKGGFAVGGYDVTGKGAINQDFMYLTPQTTGSGKYNTFMGYKAGVNTISSTLYSNYNTFLGYQAGFSNTYGYSNVFIGYNAGYSNQGNTLGNNGYNNVYIGQYAGEKNNGTNNVFIGDEAGKALTGGIKNVIIGSAAGQQTTGNYNTYIGGNAGRYETGSDNVMLGYNAGFGSGESNLFVVGNRNNNALISGYFDTKKIYLWGMVGINTGNPASYLEIVAPGNALRLTRQATSNYFDLGIGTNGNLVVNNQTNTGAYCTGASWVNASDRNLKENFVQIDGLDILSKIDELPVSSWNYKGDPDDVRHIGPFSQDFYKIFGLGNDDQSISTIDPAGISLIAIKELNRENKSQQKQLEEQQVLIESQQHQINELKALVDRLMQK